MIKRAQPKHTARGFPCADELALQQDTAHTVVGGDMVRKSSRVLLEEARAEPQCPSSALVHMSPTAAFGRKRRNEVGCEQRP